MTRAMVHAFESEWLKRKRSFTSTIVIGGSLFTPAVVFVLRLVQHRSLPLLYAGDSFWPKLWRDSWESMAIFFLPLCAILATGLIVQIEFKSNAWKRAHTLPMTRAALFVSKLAVIVVMLIQFLLLFNVGIYLSGIGPALLLPGVPMPKGSFLALPLMRENARYLLECLPIVAAQYLMALRSHNALIPIGIGFLAWVGALAVVSSKMAVWWPYTYTILHYLQDEPKAARVAMHAASPMVVAALFLLIAAAGYVLFIARAEKG